MIRNPYVHFLNLLPKQSKWIGQVTGKLDDGHVFVKQIGTRSTDIICEHDAEINNGTFVLITDKTITNVLTNAQDIQEAELV